jgi:hypothetical protein
MQSRLGAAMTARDHANTEWLKGIVAERGWPTISQVGEEAAFNAWLLVQHADHDPLFQLRSLRLMEPLVAQGEVTKQNYAYLYDRIMLKLAGKQRYATQVMCRDGGEAAPAARGRGERRAAAQRDGSPKRCGISGGVHHDMRGSARYPPVRREGRGVEQQVETATPGTWRSERAKGMLGIAVAMLPSAACGTGSASTHPFSKAWTNPSLA